MESFIFTVYLIFVNYNVSFYKLLANNECKFETLFQSMIFFAKENNSLVIKIYVFNEGVLLLHLFSNLI